MPFCLYFQDGLSRTVEERIRLGFILMKLPVIDDAPYRIFDTMKEYRKWADENLPNRKQKGAKRQRDKEGLPRLEAFRDELKKGKTEMAELPEDYNVA